VQAASPDVGTISSSRVTDQWVFWALHGKY